MSQICGFCFPDVDGFHDNPHLDMSQVVADSSGSWSGYRRQQTSSLRNLPRAWCKGFLSWKRK